jgi:multidrug efflux system outer membrane protein
MRFRNGVDNFLNVLVSQRALFSAQQSLIGVRLARLQNLVTLYKALGGGWLERGDQRTASGDAASAAAGRP